MAPLDQKEKFLATRMSELPLGKGTEKLFLLDVLKHPIPLSDVITLAEFIELNKLVVKKSDLLVCNKKNQKILNQQTLLGKQIMQFLLEQGFTSADLPILRLKVKKDNRSDLSVLDKGALKLLPYVQVCHMSIKGETTTSINKILEIFKLPGEENIYNLKNFLQLSQANLMSVFFNDAFSLAVFPKLVITLQKAQDRLKNLGFTEQDGPFMIIPQKWFSKKDYKQDNMTTLLEIEGQLNFPFPVAMKVNKSEVCNDPAVAA